MASVCGAGRRPVPSSKKPKYAKFSVTDSLQGEGRIVSRTQRQPADVPLRGPVTNAIPQRFKCNEQHVAEVARTGDLSVTQRSMIGLPRKKQLLTHAIAGTHFGFAQLCNVRHSIFNATDLAKHFLGQSLRSSRGCRLPCRQRVSIPALHSVDRPIALARHPDTQLVRIASGMVTDRTSADAAFPGAEKHLHVTQQLMRHSL